MNFIGPCTTKQQKQLHGRIVSLCDLSAGQLEGPFLIPFVFWMPHAFYAVVQDNGTI
jgi:hypothetical protein